MSESPTKKRVNLADFTSRWDYTKATSNWHFDPNLPEDATPPFLRVAIFEGQFQSIVEKALKINSPNTLSNRMRNGSEPFTAQIERNDMKKIGIPEDHVRFNEARENDFEGGWPEDVLKMIQVLGIQSRGLGVAVHVQYPGQIFPLHIDVFPFMKENREHHILDDYPEAAARFTIQLKDWEWGHLWMYGNASWKQWVAGEVSFHAWRDIPHCTANAGFSPRVSLQISGLVTEKTKKLFTAAEPGKPLPRIRLSQISLESEV